MNWWLMILDVDGVVVVWLWHGERQEKCYTIRTNILLLSWQLMYCQAKVQSKSSPSPKSKIQSPRLDLRWHYNWKAHHHITACATHITACAIHPTRNFSSTSRGPTTKCYTFLETSHDPQLRSLVKCQKFANFFATLFCKPLLQKLPVVLPPCVIPFWKPQT